MGEPVYLTAAKAAELKIELEELKGPKRLDIASRLRSAIQQGDLSENADYHKAKEDQSFLEGRIQELEYLLNNATIVETQPGQQYDKVDIGAQVTIQEEDSPPETYVMVGAKEADPRQGKISNESPIGRALMGAKVGDTVLAQTPNGSIKLKVTKIE
jgi:transcription elongation factor GreA